MTNCKPTNSETNYVRLNEDGLAIRNISFEDPECQIENRSVLFDFEADGKYDALKAITNYDNRWTVSRYFIPNDGVFIRNKLGISISDDNHLSWDNLSVNDVYRDKVQLADNILLKAKLTYAEFKHAINNKTLSLVPYTPHAKQGSDHQVSGLFYDFTFQTRSGSTIEVDVQFGPNDKVNSVLLYDRDSNTVIDLAVDQTGNLQMRIDHEILSFIESL